MVRRTASVLLALLLAGCPDDFGSGFRGGSVGLLAPTGLAAVPEGGSRVRLSWLDHATTETGYRLEMNDVPFGTPTIGGVEFLPSNATSAAYATAPNATCYFRVFAITADKESEPSNVVVITMPDVPLPPPGFAARPHASTQIRLSWQDVTNETGYVIERLEGGSWVEKGSVAANQTLFVSDGMMPDTEYAHRLVAVNANGRGTPTDPALAFTTTSPVFFRYPYPEGNFGLFTSIAAGPGSAYHIAHYDPVGTNAMYSRWLGLDLRTYTADGGAGGSTDLGGDGTAVAVETNINVHILAHDLSHDILRHAGNGSGSWVATSIDGGGGRPRLVRDEATGTLHAVYQSQVAAGLATLRYARKPPGQPWDLSTLLPTPVLPASIHSLALDGQGVPRILLAASDGTLHLVTRPAAGSATSEPLPYPAAQGAPDFTSLAIHPDGTIHAFYRGSVSKSLYHLVHAPGGFGWSLEQVDSVPGEDLGSYCSAVVEPSGRAVVAYYDATRKDLKYAFRNPGTVSWERRVVDAAADVGAHASLVSLDGYLIFAYRDESAMKLKVAIRGP